MPFLPLREAHLRGRATAPPNCSASCISKGLSGGFGCNPSMDASCGCSPPASGEFLSCVQAACSSSDVQQFLAAVEQQCAAFGASFDPSGSSTPTASSSPTPTSTPTPTPTSNPSTPSATSTTPVTSSAANVHTPTTMITVPTGGHTASSSHIPVLSGIGVSPDATGASGVSGGAMPSATVVNGQITSASPTLAAGSAPATPVAVIAGAVVGGIVGLALLAVLATCILLRHRRQKARFQAMGHGTPMPTATGVMSMQSSVTGGGAFEQGYWGTEKGARTYVRE